jgi:acid phosphatase (class A)
MRKFLLLFFIACTAAAQAPAIQPPETAPRAAPSRQPFYLAPAEIAFEKILAPPPISPSQAYKDDLQAVLDLQRSRTDAEAQDARADAETSPFRFADVLGPEFRADKLPLTAKFLRQAASDAGRSTGAVKDHFNRLRPYAASSEVHPILEKIGASGSYPSGHSTYGHTLGILLSLMVPEKSSELFDRATRYGRNRTVAGMHYPTDVEAGRICAAVVVNALLHNEKFLADLEQSRAELRQALGYK